MGRHIISLAVAIGAGIAITIQSTLNGRVGRSVGAVGSGLLINVAGGAIAALLLVATILFVSSSELDLKSDRSALLYAAIAGAAGIVIIMSIAFAIQRLGVASALSAIIFGQMFLALIVDALGLSGGDRIPISAVRVAGLGLLLVGMVLILPFDR